MSHGDEAENVPDGFEIIGHTESSRAAAIANKQKTIFGIQFHPEVVHTEKGTEIMKNFVLDRFVMQIKTGIWKNLLKILLKKFLK